MRTTRLIILALAVTALLGVIAAFAQSGPSASPYKMVVKNAAVAKGERVLLGEIAEPLDKASEPLWRELSGIKLWSAPTQRGRAVAHSRGEVQDALAHYLGPTADMVLVPGGLTLQRGGSVLTMEELDRKVVEYLTPTLGTMDGEASVRDLNAPQTVFTDEPYAKIDFSEFEVPEPGRNFGRVNLVTVDGRVLRRITVSYFLDQWLAVPCAARPIQSGELVLPDAVTFVKKNAAFLRGKVWDGKGGPWRTKGSVGTEFVIYADNLEAMPLICEGDRVNLLYRGTHVQLQTPAEAMEDGGLGERIPVKNVSTERVVTATVISKDTVVVR